MPDGGSGSAEPVSYTHLEDPAFEKLFAVYATDQVEARYLLSPSLMERLVASRQKLDAKVQAAFMDDHVILAIPDAYNRFEPPSFWSSSPLLSEDDVQTYACLLYTSRCV